MAGPSYHMRINKAADRFSLIEIIKRLPKLKNNLDEYTYYGFGGPFLEDMRLIYEFYPEIRMISFEEIRKVFLRQKFHIPCGPEQLTLENCNVTNFIDNLESTDEKSIFWLDYTDLDLICFTDFEKLLNKLSQGSVIKITIRADPRDYWIIPKNIENRRQKSRMIENFRRIFGEYLPRPSAVPSWKSEDFAYLLQEMMQIVVQNSLSADITNLTFYPISSFYYSDSTWMFSITGIIWPRTDFEAVEDAFKDWEFKNLVWNRPIHIDIPNLSTKERLHLQKHLPRERPRGPVLRAEMGHLIDEDIIRTEYALEQYAAFHRYFPYFLRGIP
jgi:hypothetical protein